MFGRIRIALNSQQNMPSETAMPSWLHTLAVFEVFPPQKSYIYTYIFSDTYICIYSYARCHCWSLLLALVGLCSVFNQLVGFSGDEFYMAPAQDWPPVTLQLRNCSASKIGWKYCVKAYAVLKPPRGCGENVLD